MNPVHEDVLAALDYAYFEVDLKGIFTKVNQPFLDKSETTLDWVIGRHYRRLVNPAQVPTLFHAFHRLYESKQTERIMFSFVRHLSGGFRVAEGMIGPCLSETGDVSGFRGILFDVTEHIEEKIRLEAEKESAQGELEIGKRIQSSFLPTSLPQVEGWKVDARFQSAREVAGDFYDIFPISNGQRLGFVVADVCDKGVGAAMYMAIFRTLLRAFASLNFSLSLAESSDVGGDTATDSMFRRRSTLSTGALPLQNAVYLTNQYIARTHGDSNMFATVFFGALNPQNGHLLYINAGHEPPMIVSRDGAIARLEPTGPAVGLMESLAFKMSETTLQPGDLLFAYTDGVVDARNPANQSFGEEHLIAELRRAASRSGVALDHIMSVLTEHIATQDQFDDLTLLTLRYEH